jgi:hypothetical protein
MSTRPPPAPRLERVFRQLVEVLHARYPAFIEQPFEVGELHQSILPYRYYRRELAVPTNDEYELLMLELLSGAGGYLVVGDRMREALERELRAQVPDTSVFRQFATEQVSISPAALRALEGWTDGPSAGHRAASALRDRITGRLAAIEPDRDMRTGAGQPGMRERPLRPPEPGSRDDQAHCRYCTRGLPPGRVITFCPSCGQNLAIVTCPACNAEIEAGWRFCVVCGRPTGADPL